MLSLQRGFPHSDTFSDSHILRSPAHRTAPAISLPSPSNLTGHLARCRLHPACGPRVRILRSDSPVQPEASGTAAGLQWLGAAGPPPPPGDQSPEARCSSGCRRIPPGPHGPARAPSAPHLKLGRTPPGPCKFTSRVLGGPKRKRRRRRRQQQLCPGVPARRPRVLAPLPASVPATPRMPAI